MITVLGQIGKRDWETYEDTLSQIDRCIEKTDRQTVRLVKNTKIHRSNVAQTQLLQPELRKMRQMQIGKQTEKEETDKDKKKGDIPGLVVIQRSRHRIPAPDNGQVFFTLVCCKKV